MSYQIRITAGGISLFVTGGADSSGFNEKEAYAATFSDNFGNLHKYVLEEIKHLPFVSGMVGEEVQGPSYEDIGLEKIELIYNR